MGVVNRLLEIRCVRSRRLIRSADTVFDPRQFTRALLARVEGASGNRIGYVSRAKDWLDGPGAVHRVNCGIRLKLPAYNLPNTPESIFTYGGIPFRHEACTH